MRLWEPRIKQSGYLKEDLSTLKEQEAQKPGGESLLGLFMDEKGEQDGCSIVIRGNR